MNVRNVDDRRGLFLSELEAHRGLLARVASAYADRGADPQDLFQEIVLQLWRAWPRYRGEAAFGTWAFRVALNTALFAVRSKGAQPNEGASAPEEESAGAGRDPGQASADSEALEALQACIRGLGEVDRALVLLHLEERTHAEIADYTGLSAGNVATRLHRVRGALRACLLARGHGKENPS